MPGTPAPSPTFARVAKQARVFLKAHDAAAFEALCAQAALATPEVPEARRGDWEKLLAGLTQNDPDPKRDARVEGLVRACKLFAAEEKRAAEERTPLAWEDALDRITGIGAASSEELAARGVRTIADLVWTLPQAYDDLRQPLGVGEAIELAQAAGEPRRVVVAGRMESASVVPMRGRRSIRVIIAPPASEPQKGAKKIHAWWFFMAHGVLSMAKAGGPCLVVGKLRAEPGKPARTMHAELFVDRPDARVVRPRYPRLGIAEATLRKSIASALDRIEGVPDPVPRKIAAREKLPPIADVLTGVHGSKGTLGDLPTEPLWRAARERLAWAEAFTRARERILAEERQGDAEAMALPIDRGAIARLQAELGFALTAGQKRAIAAIAKDLAQSSPMRRLLLGDVGTGKTAVALAAAAQAVAAGTQVAILAPTSVLAEQYMEAVGPLARASKASIALVAAGGRVADRRRAEAGIASGAIAIAVGTHALLRESLVFHKLGLVVVDEQHRLGVAQRLSLVAKGSEGRGGARPHLLTLSATPIPRTLALALRGELATSTLDERPMGRPPVKTVLWPREKLEAVVKQLRAVCERGERAFFISPRISIDEEDDDSDPSLAAIARAEELAGMLAPFSVGLLHGGMKPAAKMEAMRAFRDGRTRVLVATTVVEVGVDVPEATLMVIDAADRFGLAQLHQMRGRVGRGDRPGACVLLHDVPLADLAKRRLDALCTYSSGEEIARADLELRGAGDLGGTRQSGMEEELLYLDEAESPPWLARIDADARRIHATDPDLTHPDHRALALVSRRLATAIAVREEAG